MKYTFYCLNLIICMLTNTFCQGQDIQASLNAKQYAYTDSNTAIDLYFKIDSDHLRIRSENEVDYVDVNLTYSFNLSSESELFYGENLKISIKTSELSGSHFLYKASIVLEPNTYNLAISINDANYTERKTFFNVDYPVLNKYDEHMSDVFLFTKAQPCDKSHLFNKAGFALFPKFQNGDYLYSKSDSILNYYVEFYNLKSDEKIYMERYIRPNARVEGLKSTFSTKELPKLDKKIESRSINISDLPSGNYVLTFNVFTERKKVLKRVEIPFQRINPIKKKESAVRDNKNAIRELFKKTLVEKFDLNNSHRLNQLIASLSYRAPKDERTVFYNAIDNPDLKVKQNFFISYWEKQKTFHPLTAIENFINIFEAVQDRFSFRKKDGYKTPKGRVFLEYGNPDDTEKKSPDNRSTPYEIWHYYKLKNGQGNVIFVFMEDKGSGGYRLIHSNASEELQNPNWENINRSLNSSN